VAKHPAVYILASRYRGTLYTGVTSSLWSRVCDHKNATTPGFTTRFNVTRLVRYEHRHTMDSAIRREKADQGLEACLENRNDRSHEPGLARPA
jgi:putative endonuclease